jgi:trimeric autotransporter adhesin
MLKSEASKPKQKLLGLRAAVSFGCLLAAWTVLQPCAFGQGGFTLNLEPFPYPAAINPGGSDATNVSMAADDSFSGTVALTCTVVAATQQPTGSTVPSCLVSPDSVTPSSGGASVTVSTAGLSPSPPPGRYIVTITGTASGVPQQSTSQNLSVQTVTPQFTITVVRAVAPASVPAGNAAEGTINITPAYGYTGTVTLSCSSVTPLVTIPPVCSFNPQPATVSNGVVSSIITIATYPLPATTSTGRNRGFTAFWLVLPMLALTGVGAASGSKKSRKAWSLLGLVVISGFVLLTPACTNTPTVPTSQTPGYVTPANAYTFTVTGVDANGQASSNAGTSGPSVTLTVTAPSN